MKTTSEKQNAPVGREEDFVPIFLIASSLSHSLVSVSLFYVCTDIGVFSSKKFKIIGFTLYEIKYIPVKLLTFLLTQVNKN